MNEIARKLIDGEITPEQLPGGTLIMRMNWFHRLIHYIIYFTFMGLVYTGMPLKFRNAVWAQWMMEQMGGVHTAGLIHRICGGITWGYLLVHICWLIYCLIVPRMGLGLVYGPDSAMINLQDFRNYGGMVRWFLGKAPQPRFGRFTYWEKFDYLAVFWGVMMIGLSGLMLWFPHIFALVLPGISFNIATIIHSDEAVLATGFIFVVHWFNAHWRREKYPLDAVVFTGKMSKEEMMHEKPLEWERLVQDIPRLAHRINQAS